MLCEGTQTSFASVLSLHQLAGLSRLQSPVQSVHSPLRKRPRSCSKQAPLQQQHKDMCSVWGIGVSRHRCEGVICWTPTGIT